MDIEIIPQVACAVVRLRGETAINNRNREQLYDRLSAALRAHPRLVLDCSTIETINSTGLGTLVALLGQAQERGGTLALAALRPMVRELIELSVKHLFPMFDDVERAVAGLA